MASDKIVLPVLHFNDVYNMTISHGNSSPARRVVAPNGELTNTSFEHVIAFAQKIDDIRNQWGVEKGQRQGLLLFSGDLFSPSVESLLTRGSNMVHLMNQLEPDACVPGNHEFDYGLARFNELAEFCNFPWILSNRKYPTEEEDDPTKKDPAKKDPAKEDPVKEDPTKEDPTKEDPTKEDPTKKNPSEKDRRAQNTSIQNQAKKLNNVLEYTIISRKGLQIGIIGLMSNDTLDKTNTESRNGLNANDMTEACKTLAARLREHKKCDLIIALTHATHEEDIALSKAVGAVRSNSKDWKDSLDQVDVIFGGHDHVYYLGRGIEHDEDVGAERNGEIDYKGPLESDKDSCIVKTGTDFEDLNEVEIVAIKQPNNTARKTVVTSVKAIRHDMKNRSKDTKGTKGGVDPPMARVLQRVYKNEVLRGLHEELASLEGDLELKEGASRLGETKIGNWVADSLLRWYRHLVKGDENMPHAIIINGGSIRSNGDWKEGSIVLKQIIELMPFTNNLTMLKISGERLKKVLNSALSESSCEQGVMKSSGSFPIVSDMRIEWSSSPERKSERVNNIYFFENGKKVKLEPGRDYRILTSTFLAEGNDNFGGFQELIPFTANFANIPMYQALKNSINDMARERARVMAQVMAQVMARNKVQAEFEKRVKEVEEELTRQFSDVGEDSMTGQEKRKLVEKMTQEILSWWDPTPTPTPTPTQDIGLLKIDFSAFGDTGDRLVDQKDP